MNNHIASKYIQIHPQPPVTNQQQPRVTDTLSYSFSTKLRIHENNLEYLRVPKEVRGTKSDQEELRLTKSISAMFGSPAPRSSPLSTTFRRPEPCRTRPEPGSQAAFNDF